MHLHKIWMTGIAALLSVPLSIWSATVSGTVTSGNPATPVANATVVLANLGNIGGGGGGGGGGAGGIQGDTVKTDAAGKYSFTVADTGNHFVIVTATGYNNGNAQANITSTTQDLVVNITLTAVTAPAAPGKVSGIVTGGAPAAALAGAQVIISRTGGGGGGMGGGGGFAPDTVVTGADGAYAFDSIPAQTNYVISVRLTGYQPAALYGVDVTTGQTTTANITLIAVVTGDTTGTISGLVRISGGAALAQARVILSRFAGGGGGGGGGTTFAPETTLTDAQGKYAFDKLARATGYTLNVSLTGYSTQTANNINLTANQVYVAEFDMVASTSVFQAGRDARNYRLTQLHGQVFLAVEPLAKIRRLEFFSANGSIRYRVQVPAGASIVSLPEALSRQTGLHMRLVDVAPQGK